MGKMEILGVNGTKVGEEDIPEKLEKIEISDHAIYLTIKSYLSNQRKGLASTKTRSEVNFSTKKPWRQKGTGMARVGTRGNPVWRKGGIAFGPKPRDFSIKVPRKIRQKSLNAVLSERLREDKVKMIDTLKMEAPSTKKAAKWLKKLGFERKVLVVNEKYDRMLALSLRNIGQVDYMRVSDLNTYMVAMNENLLIDRESWVNIKRRLSGDQ